MSSAQSLQSSCCRRPESQNVETIFQDVLSVTGDLQQSGKILDLWNLYDSIHHLDFRHLPNYPSVKRCVIKSRSWQLRIAVRTSMTFSTWSTRTLGTSTIRSTYLKGRVCWGKCVSSLISEHTWTYRSLAHVVPSNATMNVRLFVCVCVTSILLASHSVSSSCSSYSTL